MFIIYEIKCHPVYLESEHARIDPLSGEFNLIVHHIFHLCLIIIRNDPVQGNDNPHIKLISLDSLGQRSYYICQTARLDKGNCFRRDI